MQKIELFNFALQLILLMHGLHFLHPLVLVPFQLVLETRQLLHHVLLFQVLLGLERLDLRATWVSRWIS